MIRAKYEAYAEAPEEERQDQYIYLWERMKAVRQDLTVQRIRNEFTVEVYEMHSRICLEFDDQTEFNQCQAQLTVLYEEGLGTAAGQREFTSYNILYNVGKGALNNVADLMRDLTKEDYDDEFIAFALGVRAATAIGNFVGFFRLYANAPGHAAYVMDTFVDSVRLDALKVLLKGYAPTVPAVWVGPVLGYETVEEGVNFLEDHGCVIKNDTEATVDCKASRAALVDYSISQRLEEERKDAQRKAEIIPISFS